MILSGAIGFGLFLTIHKTDIWKGKAVKAACFQIIANVFVFYCYNRGFVENTQWNLDKIFGLIGMIFPVVMGTITTITKIYPAIRKHFR